MTHTTSTIFKDVPVALAEGKLPVKMKDGKLLPIEMTVKVRFDPNTQNPGGDIMRVQIKYLRPENDEWVDKTTQDYFSKSIVTFALAHLHLYELFKYLPRLEELYDENSCKGG